jgi:sensor histidine kinase YesM
VKYAVEPFSDTGRIEIDISANNGKLNIIVTDNGKRNFNEINFDSGIGLSNTRERLEQLFPEAHRFTIQPNTNGKGVIVAIEIPNQIISHATVENSYS